MPFISLIRARIVSSEIALSHRPKQRIADRMNEDIGIGMSEQAFAVRNVDPAQG